MSGNALHNISTRTIGRLSLYRRLLNRLLAEGTKSVHSHELAALARVSAAEVRRDLMAVGYQGSPSRGYGVAELLNSVGELLDDPQGQGVALVGVGNLGRAIMQYLAGRRPRLSIVAAFDNDPQKANRVLHGCRCFSVADLPEVVRSRSLRVAIIAVPATEAQHIAESLIAAGVREILSFAPVRLRVPPEVYVEDMVMAVSLEKVAYFARHARGRAEEGGA